jgi:hypothetical protein
MWKKWLELPVKEPDFEWLMIDASHVKVYPGAVGGNHSRLSSFTILEKVFGDRNNAVFLSYYVVDIDYLVEMEGGDPYSGGSDNEQYIDFNSFDTASLTFNALIPLGELCPDTNAILGAALASGMAAVIPPGKNRKEQRAYDKE